MASYPLARGLTSWFAEGSPFIPTGENFHRDLEGWVRLAGGTRPAGRILGLPESSIRRWLGGVTPRREIDLVKPWRHLMAGFSRFVDAYNGYTSMVVHAYVEYSSDGRDRIMHVGAHIPHRRIQAVLRAWEDGNDRVAHNNLALAIKEDYFRIPADNRSARDFVKMGRIEHVYFE